MTNDEKISQRRPLNCLAPHKRWVTKLALCIVSLIHVAHSQKSRLSHTVWQREHSAGQRGVQGWQTVSDKPVSVAALLPHPCVLAEGIFGLRLKQLSSLKGDRGCWQHLMMSCDIMKSDAMLCPAVQKNGTHREFIWEWIQWALCQLVWSVVNMFSKSTDHLKGISGNSLFCACSHSVHRPVCQTGDNTLVVPPSVWHVQMKLYSST